MGDKVRKRKEIYFVKFQMASDFSNGDSFTSMILRELYHHKSTSISQEMSGTISRTIR